MNAIDSPSSPGPRPVVLCVLDGWGCREEPDHNAIAQAETPVYERLMRDCPNAVLRTSGVTVGLPDGQMGNSEVGHMNLGGGRVVVQDLPRIDAAIEAGELAGNPVLGQLVEQLRKTGGVCHLMGLASPGGVHSHQDHIIALARILDDNGIAVAFHAFLDGRDTPPESAAEYVGGIVSALEDRTGISFATIAGRYYAMDRDRRWDRVAKAYACLVDGHGTTAADPVEAIRSSYQAGTGDEFVVPTVIGDFAGMADGDGLLMANFRSDRVRQILSALTIPGFDEFERSSVIGFSTAVGMVEYSQHLAAVMSPLFEKRHLANTMGELVSRAGLRQLRIAETEKYAHVTFFFNGGEEAEWQGEDRILVPSPDVATYDLRPEMSAVEVTDRLVEAIETGDYDFIVVNYANADMVGHTGNMAAAIKAVEAIDHCLGRLGQAVESAGGALVITSDHGNVELMRDQASSQPHTAHTTNRVPVILVGDTGRASGAALDDGRLADVAPTLLDLMNLPQPDDMTGHSLLRSPATNQIQPPGKTAFREQRASV